MKKHRIVVFGFGLKENGRGREIILQEWEELTSRAKVIFVEPEDQTIEREIREADVLVIMKPRLPANLIELGERLKGIVKFGVGIDRIDIDYATGKGIVVANTAPGLTQSSAEATITMMMAVTKGLVNKIELVKKGIVPKAENRGVELYGKTLGVIGLGRIGSRVAQISKAIGMKVIAYDPHIPKEKAKELGVRLVDLQTLLRESEIVSIHCSLSKETYRMIGERELSLMKKNAFLINLSRGAVVDEEALYRFLKDEKIAGAGLDVWEIEPVQPSNPLVNLPNVVATPHYLCLTWESFVRKARMTQDAILKILSNKRPKYVVNPSVYDSKDPKF
jgi:D-3-phosphoglycerate dehydrogenase